MKAWKPVWILCSFAVLLSCLSSTVRADAASYETLIRRAVAEYQSGAWEEARALFRKAHALEPNARTLRGMGLSAYELHRYVDCIADFEAALQHSERVLDPTQRTEVETLLAQARGFVSSYELEIEPVEAQVLVDGVQASVRNGLTLLDPGVHTLVVRAPGYREWHQQLQVPAGGRRNLRIVLQPDTEAAQPAALEPIAHPTPAPPGHDGMDAAPSESSHRRHPYTWGFGTVAAVGLGTGLSLWLAAFATSKRVQSCDPDVRNCEPDISRGHSLERGSFIAYGAGAALGLSSLAAYVVERRSEPKRTALALHVSVRRLSLSTRF